MNTTGNMTLLNGKTLAADLVQPSARALYPVEVQEAEQGYDNKEVNEMNLSYYTKRNRRIKHEPALIAHRQMVTDARVKGFEENLAEHAKRSKEPATK